VRVELSCVYCCLCLLVCATVVPIQTQACAEVRPWLSLKNGLQLRELLNTCVSRRTIYEMTKEGRLPVFRIGKERRRRFRKEDLDKVPHPVEHTANVEAFLDLTHIGGRSPYQRLAGVWAAFRFCCYSNHKNDKAGHDSQEAWNNAPVRYEKN
jgi:excisionase family DNA binding protein